MIFSMPVFRDIHGGIWRDRGSVEFLHLYLISIDDGKYSNLRQAQSCGFVEKVCVGFEIFCGEIDSILFVRSQRGLSLRYYRSTADLAKRLLSAEEVMALAKAC